MMQPIETPKCPATYRVVRVYRATQYKRTLYKGLTEREAIEATSDPVTNNDRWYDGYEKE